MPTNDTNPDYQTQATHTNRERAEALLGLKEVFFTWYHHEKRTPLGVLLQFLTLMVPVEYFRGTVIEDIERGTRHSDPCEHNRSVRLLRHSDNRSGASHSARRPVRIPRQNSSA